MLRGADLYEEFGAAETRKNAKILQPLNIGLAVRGRYLKVVYFDLSSAFGNSHASPESVIYD